MVSSNALIIGKGVNNPNPNTPTGPMFNPANTTPKALPHAVVRMKVTASATSERVGARKPSNSGTGIIASAPASMLKRSVSATTNVEKKHVSIHVGGTGKAVGLSSAGRRSSKDGSAGSKKQTTTQKATVARPQSAPVVHHGHGLSGSVGMGPTEPLSGFIGSIHDPMIIERALQARPLSPSPRRTKSDIQHSDPPTTTTATTSSTSDDHHHHPEENIQSLPRPPSFPIKAAFRTPTYTAQNSSQNPTSRAKSASPPTSTTNPPKKQASPSIYNFQAISLKPTDRDRPQIAPYRPPTAHTRHHHYRAHTIDGSAASSAPALSSHPVITTTLAHSPNSPTPTSASVPPSPSTDAPPVASTFDDIETTDLTEEQSDAFNLSGSTRTGAGGAGGTGSRVRGRKGTTAVDISVVEGFLSALIDEEADVEEVCDALNGLIVLAEDHATFAAGTLYDRGGIPIILGLMARLPDNVDVQIKCSALMKHMVMGNEELSSLTIYKQQGISAILNAVAIVAKSLHELQINGPAVVESPPYAWHKPPPHTSNRKKHPHTAPAITTGSSTSHLTSTESLASLDASTTTIATNAGYTSNTALGSGFGNASELLVISGGGGAGGGIHRRKR
ncbi:hypothetical protein HK102_007379, partial [Quaeritorhiza haematococci]